MATQQRVSAIVTAYNGASFVADAIESILAQTRPVDEIVVIDDGSTDNTAEIVDRYRPNGVRCVRQENRGLPLARNRGIAETTGELIAFLDCDDMWLPEKNALEVDYLLAHPHAALVTGHAWWWDPNTQRRWLEFVRVDPSRLRRDLLISNCVGNASGTLIRRELLKKTGGFDPRQIWAEDWDLWLRLASEGDIGGIDRAVIVYRVVPTSLTHQRMWDRVEGYFHLSMRAIDSYAPSNRRPLLRARAISKRELGRAVVAVHQGLARRKYLRHAAAALLVYPFDQTVLKLKHFSRALLGSAVLRAYRWLRARAFALFGRSVTDLPAGETPPTFWRPGERAVTPAQACARDCE